MGRRGSRRNALRHLRQPRLHNILRLLQLARPIFHLQTILHLLQVPPKLLFILIQLAYLGLNCHYILPHYVYLIVVLNQALLVLRLQVSQLALFAGQLSGLLRQSARAIYQAYPIFEDFHGLGVYLGEGEDCGLSSARGLSLPPNFLQDAWVETMAKIGVRLFVEYLCQLWFGDEGFFTAVVSPEHLGDVEETVFGTCVHRQDYNYWKEIEIIVLP